MDPARVVTAPFPSIVNEKVWPGSTVPESNEPSSAVTVCGRLVVVSST